MTLPNFLIIGAGKCGSSSLAYQLGQHLDISICSLKEPHFFNVNWEKGVNWYARLFTESVGYRAIGEASITYTLYPVYQDVPKRISKVLGSHIRLIYLVRHPVERLLSHFRHDQLQGYVEVGTSVDDMLTDPKYIAGSCYAEQLEQFFPYFDSDRIRVVLFEDYIKEPLPVLRELFDFLDVDSTFQVPDVTARNISDTRRRWPGWYKALKKIGKLPVVGDILKNYVVKSGIKKNLEQNVGQKVAKIEISEAVYQKLYESFLPDIRKLSDYIDRDFVEVWRNNG